MKPMMFDATQPKAKQDIHTHQRSGLSRTFDTELKPETVQALNHRLGSLLTFFSYQ
jgi:hypothetical protein